MPAPFVIALSGASTSGKTLMSGLLCSFLSRYTECTVLHQDDYYKPSLEIPLLQDGCQNWDCAEALDFRGLTHALWNECLTLQCNKAKCPDESSLAATTLESESSTTTFSAYQSLLERGVLTIKPDIQHNGVVLLEGFMLFGRSVDDVLLSTYDMKILLRTTFEQACRRREARDGYQTSDGLWKDPPNYFRDVVWPNYIEEHAHLFADGDVLGIPAPGIDVHIGPIEGIAQPSENLSWLLDLITCESTHP